MYNMIPYKSKVMHIEDNIMFFSPTIYNINDYPQEEINFGDYSSMVFQDDGHLCDTIISDNTDLISNNVPEICDPFLSYIHIGCKK